jgi:hypothetical protein
MNCKNARGFEHQPMLANYAPSACDAGAVFSGTVPDWDEAKPYLPDQFHNEELGLKCPLAIDRASAPTADPREQGMRIRAMYFRQRCIGKLALKPGETVIDAGCGTGLSFPALENGIGSGGSIIGIDQS